MPSKQNDEDLLLKMLFSDDKRVINILFSQHYRRLYKLVSCLINDTTVAKDILQDLFVSIWVKRHSLNIRRPILDYLIKASVNSSFNHLRYRERHKTLYLEEISELLHPVSDLFSDAPMELEELKTARSDAIKRLSPKTRTVYILRTTFRMSHKEIARYMGVSEKTTEKHMTKAYKNLRFALKEYLKTFLLLLLSCFLTGIFKWPWVTGM